MIKAKDFQRTSRCLNLGDFVFAPQPVNFKSQEFKDAAKKFLTGANQFDLLINFMEMQGDYVSHCEKHPGKEPTWVKNAPRIIKQHLRRERLQNGVKREPLNVFFSQPYVGISFVIMEGGLTEATIRAFHLVRLNQVAQLGLLHPAFEEENRGHYSLTTRFIQTRYDHSLNVAAITTLIAHNNPTLCRSDRNHLKFAGLTHDWRTPAGGDSTKLVDPKVFNEDTHYAELFDSPAWPSIKKRYRLSEKKLLALINGQGVLGQLFKLADKIAYIARDAQCLIEYCNHLEHFQSYDLINSWVNTHPQIGSLWDCVNIIDGQLVINNTDKLAAWLKLRALNVRHVYLNPHTRTQEFVVSNLLTHYLYQTGKITREQILNKNDAWLDEQIKNFATVDLPLYHINFSDSVEIASFDQAKKAYAFKDARHDQGYPIVMVEKMPRTKPLTDLLVKHKGKLKPFEQVRPEQAEEIQAICESIPHYAVYQFEQFPMSPQIQAALDDYERREQLVRQVHLASD